MTQKGLSAGKRPWRYLIFNLGLSENEKLVQVIGVPCKQTIDDPEYGVLKHLDLCVMGNK